MRSLEFEWGLMGLKVKNGESVEERYFRENYLYTKQKKAIPAILVIFILLGIALSLYYIRISTFTGNNNNIGNPYNCESCKALGRACKEHKDFDKEQFLREKVYLVCNSYCNSDTEEDIIYGIYGYENGYNTECDFCNKEGHECYSCSYEREFIISTIEEIESDPVFISKLCDDCWKNSKASCSKCIDMLSYEVYEKIIGNND